MYRFIAKRLLVAIPTLLIISVFVFSLQKLLPGDPVLAMHVAETMATKANPNGMIDRREIDEKIAALEAARIAEGRPSASLATSLKT